MLNIKFDDPREQDMVEDLMRDNPVYSNMTIRELGDEINRLSQEAWALYRRAYTLECKADAITVLYKYLIKARESEMENDEDVN